MGRIILFREQKKVWTLEIGEIQESTNCMIQGMREDLWEKLEDNWENWIPTWSNSRSKMRKFVIENLRKNWRIRDLIIKNFVRN